MSNKQKHLELIQGVVNRLATASFQIKGWGVVLSSALFVLMKEQLGGIAFVALVPVLIFWGLDGYFLRQERLFRALYDHVRKIKEDSVDFSMDIRPFRQGWKRRWIGATLSITLFLFYMALGVAITAALMLNTMGKDT